MKNLILSTFVLLFVFACQSNKSDQVIEDIDSLEEINEDSESSEEDNEDSDSSEILTTTASELGIDIELLNALTTKIVAQEYPNIHSVLIAKDGQLFYEKYFEGEDQNFGRDSGTVQFTDTTLHDIRSVTKSIISTSVGIAIEKGYIIDVNQKVSDFFPEMEDVFVGDKSNWTIQNFLTMTTGLSWNENVPYDNPENDEVKMTISEDPVTYVLSKTLETKPGEKFNYSGGATQVLAEIIIRSSKTTLDKFVKEQLFDPLGIDTFEWSKLSLWEGDDAYAAASGLRLTSRDLMKLGLLYRNNGNWNGIQIIPSEWVLESFSERIESISNIANGNEAYGYQFWMWPDFISNNEFKMVAAIGNGGQNIYWDLKNDILVVTTAGNYNNWSIQNDPYALLKNEIYPIILNEE